MPDMIFMPAEEIRIELRKIIREEFEVIETKRKTISAPMLFTINKVAKRLKKSHATVKKLCDNGTIKTTKSGLIEESEIERYLSNE